MMEIEGHILDTVNNSPKPAIIGVSGFGGSGKSTVAKAIGEQTQTPVISVDSFQKHGAADSEYSLWGIMDFERLERDVLIPFLSGAPVIRYGHFDSNTGIIIETREVEHQGTLIVEGVGLFRPELMKYFAVTIWVDCPIDEAMARGKKRDREEHHNPKDELWEGIWQRNDIEYYRAFKPSEMAVLTIRNYWPHPDGGI